MSVPMPMLMPRFPNGCFFVILIPSLALWVKLLLFSFFFSKAFLDGLEKVIFKFLFHCRLSTFDQDRSY